MTDQPAITITREELLTDPDTGIPWSGTCKPDPDCRRCQGTGLTWDYRGRRWGTWTCICCKPKERAVVEYWQERLNAEAAQKGGPC